ncbi:MAG: DNA topoisomerase 3 [Methylococcales bacterium]|nr:DNA topoisomerase 3 [Methylococcales bacterium]
MASIDRLFIAEKPSVARAIAAELGVTKKCNGYVECGNDAIVACFGHMLEQAEPDEYTADDIPRGQTGKKLWRAQDLPIIPTEWILRPKEDAKQQLAVIERLLLDCNEVINAGDPDREGQLLIDEILAHYGCDKPIKRYWASAQDSVSVQRGLANLKENTGYHGFGQAALARARADWLIGMNLSRAFTLRALRGGSRILLTVGRVQTPTLALVVARDLEIEAFKPIPFHTINAQIKHEKGNFTARWVAKEDQQGLDCEGRLIDTNIADQLVKELTGKQASIVEYKQEAKKKPHPKAYALSDITLVASNKFGYTAADVLSVCQSLYETHKLTSYPRTDCGHLPESQHADAPRVLEALSHVNPELRHLIDKADATIKSKTWDDSKITAHHGIIPTMHKGSVAGLSVKEKNIYDLIVLSYLAQFYPVHEYKSTTVGVVVNGESFVAKGQVITRNGWRDVYTIEEEEQGVDADQKLPAMKKGDKATCLQAIRNDSKTKPPARFNEGTLQAAMENIHRFVTEAEHKKLLREGDGIGTPATRASIISELKRRGFIEDKGKQVISTTVGRSLVEVLPDVVKSPVLTALYERMMKGIEQGTSSMEVFMATQEKLIQEQVKKANEGAVSIAGVKPANPISTVHKCKSCGQGLIRRESKKKKGSFWWGCSGWSECRWTYPDAKGKPDFNKGKDNPVSA